jgi:RHS repeat-associated protein
MPDGEYGGEDVYTYASSPYGDRLVSYNGETISYDSSGRTVFYRGKDIVYCYENLSLIRSIGDVSFTYNADGMRRTKTVDGVTHTYYYDGINLISEEWDGNVLVFLYDASGSPIGMQYRNDNYASGTWDTYYYEKNLQGDIVSVYNTSGTKLVTYTYNAWGYITGTTYSNGGANTSARYNPIKYRGYYYDDDLDLYYLATRCYDPETCRFITADSYVSTGRGILGYNRYAYCNNNPVMYIDPTGEIFIGPALLIVSSIVVLTPIVINIFTIIYSENVVADLDVEPMSDDILGNYDDDNDSTYGMSNEEKVSYIRRIRQEDENLASNWSEADMLREMWYHDRGYELTTFFGSDPSVEGSLSYRFNHVHFESEQTFLTYLYRFAGNLAFWGRE